MAQNEVDKGLDISYKYFDFNYIGCILGERHRFPMPKSSLKRMINPLQLVHSDLLGALEVYSV